MNACVWPGDDQHAKTKYTRKAGGTYLGDHLRDENPWMLISTGQITLAMVEKLAVNKQREWPEPKDGEARLHIKTEQHQGEK